MRIRKGDRKCKMKTRDGILRRRIRKKWEYEMRKGDDRMRPKEEES